MSLPQATLSADRPKAPFRTLSRRSGTLEPGKQGRLSIDEYIHGKSEVQRGLGTSRPTHEGSPQSEAPAHKTPFDQASPLGSESERRRRWRSEQAILLGDYRRPWRSTASPGRGKEGQEVPPVQGEEGCLAFLLCLKGDRCLGSPEQGPSWVWGEVQVGLWGRSVSTGSEVSALTRREAIALLIRILLRAGFGATSHPPPASSQQQQSEASLDPSDFPALGATGNAVGGGGPGGGAGPGGNAPSYASHVNMPTSQPNGASGIFGQLPGPGAPGGDRTAAALLGGRTDFTADDFPALDGTGPATADPAREAREQASASVALNAQMARLSAKQGAAAEGDKRVRLANGTLLVESCALRLTSTSSRRRRMLLDCRPPI